MVEGFSGALLPVCRSLPAVLLTNTTRPGRRPGGSQAFTLAARTSHDTGGADTRVQPPDGDTRARSSSRSGGFRASRIRHRRPLANETRAGDGPIGARDAMQFQCPFTPLKAVIRNSLHPFRRILARCPAAMILWGKLFDHHRRQLCAMRKEMITCNGMRTHRGADRTNPASPAVLRSRRAGWRRTGGAARRTPVPAPALRGTTVRRGSTARSRAGRCRSTRGRRCPGRLPRTSAASRR